MHLPGPQACLKQGYTSVFISGDQWYVFYAFETEGVGYSFLADSVDYNLTLTVGLLSFRILLRGLPSRQRRWNGP